MPYRKVPLIIGETYHVFNRSVARQHIFLSDRDYQRAIETFQFYSFKRPDLRFSHFKRLPKDQRESFWSNLTTNNQKQIAVLTYCFMPNHVHFLMRETEENGIATFMKNFQNSLAKFFNTREERQGALFQAMFKAIRIETKEQLIHVARYIHLNPFTSFVIRKIEKLENYPWSSYPAYMGRKQDDFIEKESIFSLFKSVEKFKMFTLDQANYQRKLFLVKHLIGE